MSTTPVLPELKKAQKSKTITTLKTKLKAIQISLNGHPDSPYIGSEIDQILNTQTIERAQYYLERLIKGLTTTKTLPYSDINLNRWKQYTDISTDSLWLHDRRDQSDTHKGWYWGNFIPQIPNQFIRRFTKPGDWVLDTFCGSGTSLIECRNLGRNGIATELQPNVIDLAKETLENTENPHNITTEIYQADCTRADYSSLLQNHGRDHVQLAIAHPPYWDIIQYGKTPQCLSNAKTLRAFKSRVRRLIKNIHPVLEEGRHLVFVIGDKYAGGEWIPLGYECMDIIKKCGFKLKSTIVKNFDQTKGKLQQEELWRYRALANGFYVFKHEYIFLFQKK